MSVQEVVNSWQADSVQRNAEIVERHRYRNLNDPIDYRQLEYVTTYDSNLECPICRCPFIDPVALADCDHCFCRECIRQTWSRSAPFDPLGLQGECPSCRSQAKLKPHANKILINILDDLWVKCPNDVFGCDVQFKRAEVRDHVALYCGYAKVPCPAPHCTMAQQRRYSNQGCLHYGVSCLACRAELQRCEIDTHWKTACVNSAEICETCDAFVLDHERSDHMNRRCLKTAHRCPGEALGCKFEEIEEQPELHIQTCSLAKIAISLSTQKSRLDEQEVAQKAMSRKLEVLESGFSAMNHILFPRYRSPNTSATPDRETAARVEADRDSTTPGSRNRRRTHDEVVQDHLHTALAERSYNEETPAISASDTPGLDMTSPFTSASLPFAHEHNTTGPYTSPFHHILSMHEGLRDEMSRMHAALQELDGRQSLQILNENLRTREDVTYIGAQVAGLSRQVHWLTSAHLQQTTRNNAAGGATAGDLSTNSQGVDVALSAVDSAIRSAARLVETGRQGIHMRRRSSEEGRTKL